MSQVAVGPRLLDFGKVSAASRNVRYLAVSNPLQHSIHMVLALANLPELKDTEPVSQVTPLPLMQHARLTHSRTQCPALICSLTVLWYLLSTTTPDHQLVAWCIACSMCVGGACKA